MRYLKQSTSVDVGIGPFLDETDGKTAETALTITQPDVRLKKNGGAWAQKAAAQTLTHEENGWYELTLDATDTDTIGHLLVAIHESGALPVWQEYHVLAANVYDSLFGAATDKLDVNVEEWNTTAVPAEHTAGYPIVTIKDGTGTGEIDTASGKVLLADGAHGGTAAVLTLERIVVASTTLNEPSVKLTGNGSGAGLLSTGGATGDGFKLMGGATSGDGIHAEATTEGNGQHFIGRGATGGLSNAGGYYEAAGATAAQGMYVNGILGGAGMHIGGGATGTGLHITGGSSSGVGVSITTTSGDGIDIAPTAGHGIDINANGTSKHGVNVVGGTAGTSDGIKATAGTGGVDVRGNITGNLIGTVSWNAAWDAEVQSECTDALNAYDPPTKAETDALLTTALTESYAANGAAPTLTQAMLAVHQMLMQFAISGTSYTVRKLDNSTTAFVVTLNDATTPTSAVRT